mgnify:CR=1 FL=1
MAMPMMFRADRRAALAAALVALILAAAVPGPARAQADLATTAESAIVVDHGTGQVLFEKNADRALPPASLTKIMTLEMLFEALNDGRVTLETRFAVSDAAMALGGSTMFLNTDDRPTVQQLIRGIVVNSGNDAAVVVAEGLAGSESAFAELMTRRARTLGMADARFTNASGWPEPGHAASARDLAVLTRHIITEHPDLYSYFAEEEYDFEGRAPANRFNRNPMLGLGIGADGLKTGHTEEAGYGLVTSARQGERRVVVVLLGLGSRAARAREGERLIGWAFRQFVEREIIAEGARVTDAEVWMGTARSVPLVAGRGLTMLLPAQAAGTLEAEARFEAPLHAPVAAGAEAGRLVISPPGMDPVEVPLLTGAAVAEGGVRMRLRAAGEALLDRLIERAGRL